MRAPPCGRGSRSVTVPPQATRAHATLWRKSCRAESRSHSNTPTRPIKLRCYPCIRFSGNFAGREEIMADKKKAAEGGSVNDTRATDKTAKKKAAPPEVAAEPAPRTKSTKIPKLAKKNKSRL